MAQHAENQNSFNLQAFSSDVLIYSFGQAFLLIFSFIQSLIIPKYLSTTDYGYWQLFLLYTTYVGILHFGFLDGILVRWAGKNLEVLKEEVSTAFRFILLEQVVIVGILIMTVKFLDITSKKFAFVVLANAIIVNLLVFFILAAQATKNFKLITSANIGKGLIFLLFILFIFFGGYLSYFSLIIALIAAELIILSIFIFHTRDYLFNTCRPLLQYGKVNIGIGIFIMMGNFIALAFTTVDRMTVGSFFPITQFAVYTFAMSVCGLVTVFLQAVAQVFFPYLSGSDLETRKKAYRILKPTLVIFWALALAIYFPASLGIGYYLPKYTDSLSLTAILLCTVGFSGQINILHANFFKVYRKQRAYFILAGIALIGAGVLNIFAVSLFGTLTAIAFTAVISFTLWYLLNEFALRNIIAGSTKEIVKWMLVIGAYIGAFLGSYYVSKTWISGFCIYFILFAGITTICLRKEKEQLKSMILMILK